MTAASASASAISCLVLQAPGRILEVVAWQALPPAAAAAWPTQAGAVRCDANGEPVVLHFAPGRWLVAATRSGTEPASDPVADPATDPATDSATGPSIDARAAALAQVASFGIAVDVSGKWRGLRLCGADAQRLLARTLDSAAVLDGRACAAVTLFDCPAVLARAADGYRVWVQASYLAHFLAVAGAGATHLGGPPAATGGPAPGP